MRDTLGERPPPPGGGYWWLGVRVLKTGVRPLTGWVVPGGACPPRAAYWAEEGGAGWWRVPRDGRDQAGRAVSRLLGRHLRLLAPAAEHYHRGGTLTLVLTRLGGRKLDATANLPASLKYIEDGVCLMLGADDGDQRWRCRCVQLPGGRRGVRGELFLGDST